jgi:protein SCO1/2
LVALLTMSLSGCGGGSSGHHHHDDGAISGLTTHDADNLNGIVLPKPYHAASVKLEDTAGDAYDFATDNQKPLTLVFFGYTHCPDICQVVMANIASGIVRLDSAKRSKVAVYFVTTDPKRDTAKVLGEYVARFNPSFDGLTGKIKALEEASKAFGTPIEKGQRLATGGYDVTHGTNVIGLRRDGTAPYVWTQGTTPDELAEDIGKILDGRVRSS